MKKAKRREMKFSSVNLQFIFNRYLIKRGLPAKSSYPLSFLRCLLHYTSRNTHKVSRNCSPFGRRVEVVACRLLKVYTSQVHCLLRNRERGNIWLLQASAGLSTALFSL